MKNPTFFSSLRLIMRGFGYIEEIVSFTFKSNKIEQSIRLTENKIQNVLNIKELLQNVQLLNETIEASDSEHIKKIFQDLYEASKFEELGREIDLIIENNTNNSKSPLSSRIHKCFAIKVFLKNNFYFILLYNKF